MKREYRYAALGALGMLLLGSTALGGYYIAKQESSQPAKHAQVVRMQPTSHQGTQRVAAAKPPCDDNNIVGTVAGGAAGGLIGSRFGSGSGKTLATTGGIVGGAMLGNAYMPTRGVTCN